MTVDPMFVLSLISSTPDLRVISHFPNSLHSLQMIRVELPLLRNNELSLQGLRILAHFMFVYKLIQKRSCTSVSIQYQISAETSIFEIYKMTNSSANGEIT